MNEIYKDIFEVKFDINMYTLKNIKVFYNSYADYSFTHFHLIVAK